MNSSPTPSPISLRKIYPTITTCPECADRGRHQPAGARKAKHYRRCPRGHVYAIFPIGHEEDCGGMVSMIVIW